MILHRNGSIEGTPEEIAEYNKLQSKRDQFKVIEPTRLNIRDYGTVTDYVNGLFGALGKRQYH